MRVTDFDAWERTRDFIRGHIESARKRENLETFINLALDPHLWNCVEWLHRIEEKPSPAVLIATYGHDIDRALADRVVQASNEDYDNYKKRHAKHGAAVITTFLTGIGASPKLLSDVYFLVRHHDNPYRWAGDTVDQTVGLTLVKAADALSFFDVNFDHYLDAHFGNHVQVRGKMDFMFSKMCGRKYEVIPYNGERNTDPSIQGEARARILEIQARAEELVLPNYRLAVAKFESAIEGHDPGDTRQIVLPPGGLG